MRQLKGRVSRLVAGCIAAASVLGSGVTTAFASPTLKSDETEGVFNPIAITYRDDDKYADGQLPDYDPVPVNESTFPDPMFRYAVSSSFDKDGNGVLDSDELLKARNIWCNKMGVTSMAGIEYLPELRGIYCMDNQIETIDFSHNKLLTGIWCSGNKFRHLDVSMLPDLEWIYCFDCNLTELDLTHNPKMAYVECNTNPIKELDFTKNPLLEHLTCGTCELTELDLSQNPRLTHLDCFQNNLNYYHE